MGEIILVVIGILIALQINNWNEAQKNRAYEVKMLSEIKRGLIGDQINLQEQIQAYEVLKNTADKFTSLTQNMVVFHDSMQTELWNLNIGRYFQFNTGPYEALKSSGIDRVSNDSLRNHLINFFDFELIKFRAQVDHATRRYRSNVEQLLALREDPYIDNKNNWVVNSIPNDILQKPEFIWLLADIEWRATSAKNTIEKFTPKINALLHQINDEIENK
ncbi:DUF6090 family protein [[Muricauda] lutisoli]|uniref:Uncharacterized protein n=1 Tax=[Muricauda] lutisoli TaxID=2816035 RepID=A0ABS3EUA5_9FLAO|nr:DUF6090 family protein [[Muricauda] lutisoli]MBO0329838.1 hypothetical protein [[Muricauda] lutisoli]